MIEQAFTLSAVYVVVWLEHDAKLPAWLEHMRAEKRLEEFQGVVEVVRR